MDYAHIKSVFDSIAHRVPFKPDIALVLGSGLGFFADKLSDRTVIKYGDIKGFPVSTVAGHSGQYVFGTCGGVKIAAMQGRVHYYEGYTMEEVVLPVRLFKLMGAEKLLITNASGGVNEAFYEGAFMAIKDQISLFVPNPLIGKNAPELGLRFPDMVDAYDKNLLRCLERAAEKVDTELFSGVYMQVTGPSFETPAEINAARVLGADAIGMSTACECIAARHTGLRVAGLSFVSNMAAGITGRPLSHEEVNAVSDRNSERFERLLRAVIEEIHKDA